MCVCVCVSVCMYVCVCLCVIKIVKGLSRHYTCLSMKVKSEFMIQDFLCLCLIKEFRRGSSKYF